jgi:hypothetical protein
MMQVLEVVVGLVAGITLLAVAITKMMEFVQSRKALPTKEPRP